MEKTVRENALEGYKNKKDSFDWTGLMDYASKLLSSRDAIEQNLSKSEFSKKVAAEALKTATPYIKLKPLSIDPKVFRQKCVELQQLFVNQGVIHDPQQLKLIKSFNWAALSDKTIGKAGSDPTEFFILANEELCVNTDDPIAPIVLAAMLVQVVRAFLSNLGNEMTAYIGEHGNNQSLKCPTCGEAPSLSSVIESAESSKARKLFCVCCGTVWPFERVRCARCGTREPDKLSYIHSEQDKAHLLHLCSKCGGYTPTVFQESLGITFDFDVEQAAIGVVEAVYMEEMLKKEGKSILGE